jgi:hypothetical protein
MPLFFQLSNSDDIIYPFQYSTIAPRRQVVKQLEADGIRGYKSKPYTVGIAQWLGMCLAYSQGLGCNP